MRLKNNAKSMTSHHTLQPEEELLLCCARTQISAATVERVRALLLAGLDWGQVIALARHHRIQPLLYWHLRRIGLELVPQSTLTELQESYFSNAWLNHFLNKELNKIVCLFGAHNILAAPYKGPNLTALVYGNLSLRQSGDLDILVREQDVLKAKELLISQGYRPQFQLSEIEEAAYLQTQYEYNFISPDSRVAVEIHWGFAPRYFAHRFDMQQLWGRIKTTRLAGSKVLNFQPEDLLLILCIHGAKHCWSRLIWICDVAELLRVYPDLDWQQILKKAGPLSGELLLGLLLAHDLLDAPLPKEIEARRQTEPRVDALAVRVRQYLFQEADAPFERFKFHLELRSRLFDRVRYCFYLVTNISPIDLEILPLPPSLAFFYYPLRSIRLLSRYGLNPLKRML